MKAKLVIFIFTIITSANLLFAQSGTCGDNLTWVLADGTLTISGTGVMTNYSSSNYVPWDSYKSTIKSLSLPEGLTSIGNYAFASCSGLTSVEIPNSVTSIGNTAFAWCSGLKSVSIPSGVTSIGNSAFQDCSSLLGIEIPNTVTSIGDVAFYRCYGLTNVTIPSSVSNIGIGIFTFCSNLTDIVVSSTNPAYCSVDGVLYTKDLTSLIEYPAGKQGVYAIPNSVTSIERNAFAGCAGLTSVEIPNSVTSIGKSAFGRCSSLTEVVIPNSVINLGENAFSECSSLTSVAISNSVTSIGLWTFSDCSSLTDVYIPNNVTSIGQSAFDGCSSLTSVTIPNSVTSIGGSAFANCYSLTSVSIPNNVTTIGYGAFSQVPNIVYNGTATGSPWGAKSVNGYVVDWLVYSDYTKTNLLSCSAAATGEISIPSSVTNIGDGVFKNCSKLTNVVIPNSITSIGNDAFYDCSGLTSIEIPNSVTSIGANAFLRCSNLTSVTIPEGITSIENGTFWECTSLGSVTVPNSVTNIAQYAFYHCFSLTSVSIPDGVTSIGSSAFKQVPNIVYYGTATGSPWGARSVNGYVDGWFVYSDNTKTNLLSCFAAAIGEISIPSSVSNISTFAFYECNNPISVKINNSNVNIESRAFLFCHGLTTISIPESVTSIDGRAFGDCTGLTSITFPKGIKIILHMMFNNCSSLTNVVLGDSVTFIEPRVFDGCTGLTHIEIPTTCDTIGNAAFKNCTSLSTIYNCAATPQRLGNDVFNNVNKSACTLYVPEGSIPLYQVANEWKDFIIQALPKYAITWKLDDGTTIDQTTVEYGQTPTHANPTKAATAEYTYTFVGWTPDVVAVTGDATYTATYNATKNSYTITWKQDDGSTIDQTTVEYGQTPIHADPTKPATAEYTYTFAGWSPSVVSVTGDATYTATYDSVLNKYTITFKNGDEELQSTEVEYGQVPAYTGLTPTKPSDAQYTYSFAGWSPSVVPVTGDATYTATFSATTNSYAIIWKNDDGSTLDQTLVAYGAMPTHADPSKPSTAQYTYSFAGWSPSVVSVTGDATYTATYDSILNSYELTISGEHGITTGSGTYQYGTNVNISATPDDCYHFVKWSNSDTNASSTIMITGSTNLIASFEIDTFTIQVLVDNENHGLIDVSRQSLSISSSPSVTMTDVLCGEWMTIKAHAFPDYVFVQWSDGNTDSIRSLQINEATKYVALFATKCEEYADLPVIVLYDWLLGINVTAINEMGYYISPTNVTWYRVVGEPDDMHNVFPQDDQVVATGYYLTLGQNLKGTGDYYAVVDVSDAQGKLCDGLMRTMIISYSGKAKVPQVSLMPSVAKPGQTVKVIGLDPTVSTTIQVYTTAGQLLHTFVCEDTQFSVPAEITAGCYHVRVTSSTINQTVKFIVQQ